MVEDMTEPRITPGQGCLWTTPATVSAVPFDGLKVDPNVSVEQIRLAVAQLGERARAFEGNRGGKIRVCTRRFQKSELPIGAQLSPGF